MVTVSYIGLVGNYEKLDKTLAYQITQNWAGESTGLTMGTDLTINSATGSNVQVSWIGETGEGLNQIHLNALNEMFIPEDAANGDGYQAFFTLVYVDVFAVDADTLDTICRAINSIVWKIHPSGASGTTSVKKSNGTESSHINSFDPPYIEFKKDPVMQNKDQEITHASGYLKVKFYKVKTNP